MSRSEANNPFGDPDSFNVMAAPSLTGQDFVSPVPKPVQYPSAPVAPPPADNFNTPSGFYQDSTAPRAPVYGSMSPGSSGSAAPNYVDQARANTDDLRRRQDDLEAKARDLERREAELRSSPYNVKKKNFPPLPAKFCVGPCFYQDFEVDIPLAYQSVVKRMYYIWITYSVLLTLNLIASMAYIGVVGITEGALFGLSILWVVLFIPISFLFWFRPVYKAFRSDSSLNFFIFFIIFTAQIGVTIVQCLGINACGTCGIINGLTLITRQAGEKESKMSNIGVGSFMLVVGILFAALAGIMTLMMLYILRIYRTTGASFAKAQMEFATNKTVQNTAASAATSAMRNEDFQNAVISSAQRNMYGGTAGSERF